MCPPSLGQGGSKDRGWQFGPAGPRCFSTGKALGPAWVGGWEKTAEIPPLPGGRLQRRGPRGRTSGRRGRVPAGLRSLAVESSWLQGAPKRPEGCPNKPQSHSFSGQCTIHHQLCFVAGVEGLSVAGGSHSCGVPHPAGNSWTRGMAGGEGAQAPLISQHRADTLVPPCRSPSPPLGMAQTSTQVGSWWGSV